MRDTSLKVPHGEEGTVIGVKVFDAQDGDDELGSGVNQRVVVFIAQKRKITEGDKLAGRHTATRASSRRSSPSRTCRSSRTHRGRVVLNPLGIPAA